MPPRRSTTTKAEPKRQQAKAQAAAEAPRAAVQTAPAQESDAKQRKRALDAFNPEVKKWLKDNLDINVENSRQVSTADLFNMLQSKVTSPIEFVVTPLAYDRELKESVEMPKIKGVSSFRFAFPVEDGKMVAPDDKHQIYVQNIPCRPQLEKGDGIREGVPAAAPAAEEGKGPSFTEAQVMAAEGIGIARDRLYGGFNHLSMDDKKAIAAGETFDVDGAVRTSFGSVNVIGKGRLVTASDGSVSARFDSSRPEARQADLIVDLMAGRRQGMLELDLFQRDSQGRVITDVNRVPLMNRAAENLSRYGVAMEPVAGYVHTREYDKKEKKFVDRVQRHDYVVSVVNGNLFASRMKAVPDLNPDGTKVTYKDRNGKDVERTHPEVALSRVKDGKVYIDGGAGKALEFSSPKDEENFVRGRVAFVKGATYHDFKANKDETYEAAVVADNRRAGFAKPFTPQTSRELKAKVEVKQNSRRKQNFGFGL